MTVRGHPGDTGQRYAGHPAAARRGHMTSFSGVSSPAGCASAEVEDPLVRGVPAAWYALRSSLPWRSAAGRRVRVVLGVFPPVIHAVVAYHPYLPQARAAG